MMVSFGSVNVDVNTEATRKLYEGSLDFPKGSASANFRKNIVLRGQFVKPFFEKFGINAECVQNLCVDAVDASCQTVSYFGMYPIVCHNEAALLDVAGEDFFLENVLETAFGIELSLTKTESGFSLFVFVDFPWLFDVPIPKQRYANKPVLPQNISGFLTADTVP